MGIVNTFLKIINPVEPKKFYEGEFLVDTGAQYTVVPLSVWKKIGLKPQRKQKFILADGKIVERQIGGAYVEFEGVQATTPIVLGEKNDSFIMGVVTLESLGLSINPFTRKLYSAKLML